MAFNVEYVYEILDKYSGPLQNISRQTTKFQKATERTRAGLNKLSKSLKESGRGMRDFGAGLTATVSAPIVGMGVVSLQAAAKVESLTTNFESLLGSTEAASDMMERLKKFSAATPFQLEGIASTSRMLLGFGVSQDEIIQKLKFLGDVAAGTGRSLGEIGLIFGQIKAKGKLQGEELLQLAERGIPILKTLADMYGTSQAKVQKMITAGKVRFKDVNKAFEIMTSKGGIFSNQMEKQSKTLSGLWSTLKDNFFLFTAEIGMTIASLGDVKGLLNIVTETLKSMAVKFKEFVQNNPKLAKLGLIAAGVAVAIGPLLTVLGLATIGIGGLASGMAFLLSPVAAIIAAGVGLGAMFAEWYSTGHPIIDMVMSIGAEIGSILSPFGELFGMVGSVIPAFNGLSGAIDAIGHAFIVALTPLKIFLQGIKGVMNAGSALASGNFSGALEALKQAGSNIFETGLEGLQAGRTALGADNAQNVANRREAVSNKLTAAGNISVSAAPGSKVESANIELNGGANVAFAP